MKKVILSFVFFAFSFASLAYADINMKSLAKKKWKRVETANFVIISDISAKKVRTTAEQLERFQAFSAFFLNIKVPEKSVEQKALLYVTDKRATWKSFGLDKDLVSVFASNARGETVMFADVNGFFGGSFRKSNSGRAVLLKALALKLFSDAGLNDSNYPLWFRQGFAFYLASYSEPKNSILLGSVEPYKNRISSLFTRTGALASFDTKNLFARKKRPEYISGSRASWLTRVNRFYMESFLTLHYLYADNDRRSKMVAYLKAIQAGQDQDDAFNSAFELSYTEFNSNIRSYLNGSSMLARSMDREQVMKLVELPDEFSSERIDDAQFFKLFAGSILGLSNNSIDNESKQKFFKDYTVNYLKEAKASL